MSGALEDRGAAVRHDALVDAVMGSGLSLDALEDLLLKASVARAEGNLAGAARLLGIMRPQLSYRLKKKPGAEPGEEITRE